MSKPNEVTTLTPEQILNGIYSCNPFTADIDDEVGEALQQLNTCYLNLFMECLEGHGNFEAQIVKVGTLPKRDEMVYRISPDTLLLISYNKQPIINNLKNKLGVDNE